MKKNNKLLRLKIIRLFAASTLVLIYLLFCLPISASSKGSGATRIDSSKIIKSAFDPKTASWNIDWPGRVSQYDLVYKSPPIDPMQGIALGNGDVAALAWCEDSKIILVLNKCDLITRNLVKG